MRCFSVEHLSAAGGLC